MALSTTDLGKEGSGLPKTITPGNHVLKINNIIFFDGFSESQKFKSYDRQTIFEILDYQKKYKLNNSQLARHFKLSRNTITKWKRIFLV